MPGEVIYLSRNVAIVTVILVLVVVAGYLVWLRSQQQRPVSPQLRQVQEEVEASPTATPTEETTPSAEEATPGSQAR